MLLMLSLCKVPEVRFDSSFHPGVLSPETLTKRYVHKVTAYQPTTETRYSCLWSCRFGVAVFDVPNPPQQRKGRK